MAKSDKLEHELIPEHSKLSDKEAKDLLKKYNATIKEMPKILITDPAIAHMDIKEGDIIKVDTRTGTYVERVGAKK